MAYILSLETATPTCSVALHRNDQLLAVQDFHLGKSHSSILHPLIHDLLKYCELEVGALSGIALSMGPGSYTGLRIGTSAAKGLCYALELPLIVINTLEAMARQLQPYNLHGAYLCPMLDARRMEVYCRLSDGKGREILPTSAVVVEADRFDEYLGQEVWFFGNGSDKCLPLLASRSGNARIITGVSPSAAQIGALAWEKYQRQEFADLAYFVPLYLKDFQASKPKKN